MSGWLGALLARRAEARYGGRFDSRASFERRGLPIHAMVGANGGGKSLCAVADALVSLQAGRPVLSTVRLLDFANPRPCDDPSCTSINHDRHFAAHPLYIPFTEWRQVLEIDHADVLMDEVAGVASSQDSTGMIPRPVYKAIQECRRRDLRVTWTAPFWDTAAKVLRRLTQGVTVCEGRFRVESGDETRIWYQNRLFRWVTYDARQWDEFTEGKRSAADPIAVAQHWGPGSLAFRGYDTYDSVSMIGEVSEYGRCADCGGRRSPGECTCANYVERKAARRSRSVERGPAVRGAEPDATVGPSDADESTAVSLRHRDQVVCVHDDDDSVDRRAIRFR